MREHRTLVASSLILFVVILGAVTPSVAQEEAAGEEAMSDEQQPASERTPVERAREHMERGQALYLQARFEEAAAEFRAAYEAQPFSAFLFNAGVALERAGQPDRAADLFEQYVGRDPDAHDAAAVRQRIVRLRNTAQTAQVPEGETPEREMPDSVPAEFKSLLSVRTNPEGATVRVLRRGTEVASGPAPFAHTLDTGRYLLRIEHPDYQTVEQEMRVEPGKVYVVIVEMSQGHFLGYLRVTSNIAGADVYIDDREQGPRGQTPFEAPIPVGTHNIWIERPGYRTEQTEVEVNIGEEVTARIDLTRVDFGRIRVVSNITGARVLVDGQLVGTVPHEGEVSSGPHRVRIEADGMKAWETDLDVRPGQLTPMRARLRPDVGRGGGFVTAVFSALFLGGGIAVALIGNDLDNALQIERDAGTLASDDSRLDLGLFLYIGADAAFGLSFILGALALYYFVYDPLPPSEGSVQDSRDWAFTPMFDPETGTGGMGFGGRF